jgi:mono/diheme cytochrome c family protein
VFSAAGENVAARCCSIMLLWAAATAGHTQDAPATNVPDAITRKTGLHLEPMSHAAVTYAENCQGCHGAAGVSVTEIPTLAGRIGYFARTPEGRSYLVQVPNVALNPSSDQDIAELMNWVLNTYSRAQLPRDFQPYSTEEVALLRKVRIDVVAHRRHIVEQLVVLKQIASPDVLAIPHTPPY